MRKWQRYDSRPQRVRGALSPREREGVGQPWRRLLRLGLCWSGIGVAAWLVAARWWAQQPVREIRWSGLHRLTSAELIAVLPGYASKTGAPELGQWHRALLQHPLVAEAALYWEAPGILHIAIEERRLLASVAADGQTLLCLDTAGRLHRLPREVVRERLPRARLPQLSEEWLSVCTRLLRSVPRDSIAALYWEPSRGWMLSLRDGTVLILGDTAAVQEKWSRWSRFRRQVPGTSPIVADVRWSGLVAVLPPVPQPAPEP